MATGGEFWTDSSFVVGSELEQSKNETAELRNHHSKCEQQILSTISQVETEQQMADGLCEALTRSESCESELTDALEEKEEGLERLHVEEERQEETEELWYYRALEWEHEKWEPRENRALDEVNRLQKNRDGTRSTEKLEEAYQERQHLLEECRT